MNKKELFDKYDIHDRHSIWQDVDSWMSIEIHRWLNGGRLPTEEEPGSPMQAITVLDHAHKWTPQWRALMKKDIQKMGSFYLTAKRIIWQHADAIVEELNRSKY